MKSARRIFSTLLLLGATAFAQQLDPAHMVVTGIDAPEIRVTVDPASFGVPPAFMNNGGSSIAKIDTLNEHVKRTTQFMTYVYADQNNNRFPVIGANGLYLFVGQKFPIAGTARVSGVLMAVAMARVAGVADTMVVNVWPGAATTGLPSGNSLGFGRFMTDGVDTSLTAQVWSYVEMEAVTDVSGPFAVTVRTRRLSDNDDAFMLWSNQQGDGKGQRRACYITVNNNQLVAGDLAAMLSTGGVPIDIDVMLMPVVEGNVTGIDAPAPSFDGLSLLSTFPQPAANDFTARLKADRPMRVVMDLIDPAGRVIGASIVRDLISGINTVSVALPRISLPAGRYFLRISGEKTSFATPIIVGK